MATLSGSSTDAEVLAAYDDNSSYRIDKDRAKADLFIQACMILTRRIPSMATRGEQQMSRESIKSEKDSAEQWLDANPEASGETGNRTRYFAMENFRG